MENNQKKSDKKKISEFSDDSIEDIAKEIVVKRTALLIHLIIYLVVNGLLVGINYGTNKFENGIQSAWALWSITGWGIGLLVHVVYFMIFKKGVVKYSNIVAIYHTSIYLIIGGFLVFTDWVTDMTFNWIWWALGPWGAALIAHLLIVFIFNPRKTSTGTTKEKKSWMDRQVDKELGKLKKDQ